MAYRMLVTDVDGTLVDDSQNIPQENIAAAKALVERGYLVTLATGRGDTAALPYMKAMRVNAPAILYNGAKVIDPDTGAVLLESVIDKETALKVLDTAKSYDISPVVHLKGKIYVSSVDERVKEYEEDDRIVCTEVGNVHRFLAEQADDANPTKVLLIGIGNELARARERMVAAVPDHPVVVSKSTFVEVLPVGASKGAALSFILKRLGIDPRQVVAIGDAPNDQDMLALVGMGVAVANAHHEVKERAKYVAPSNTDAGFAHVAERFLLSQVHVKVGC